jgi:hypothetical protein
MYLYLINHVSPYGADKGIDVMSLLGTQKSQYKNTGFTIIT